MQRQRWLLSDAQSRKEETLWLWAQCRSPVTMMSHQDGTACLVPHCRSYFEHDKRGNGDSSLQSHIFLMTLTFKKRAWLIPDCVKVGWFFWFFLLVFFHRAGVSGVWRFHIRPGDKSTRFLLNWLTSFAPHRPSPTLRPKVPCHGLRLAQMRNTCCTVFTSRDSTGLSRGALAGLNCLLDAALSSPPWPDFNKNWVKLARNGV